MHFSGTPGAPEIKKALDMKVFGQEEYKIACAEFGCLHMKQIEAAACGHHQHRSNMLVIGKSGTGKTFALRELAAVLGVDFFEVDGANLSETGYKGSMHVDDIIQNLYAFCDEDVERTEKAIIFIDEFDKIVDHLQIATHDCDTGTMDNLLKLIEGGCVSVRENRRFSETHRINTDHISWVCAGTFGLSNIRPAFQRAGFLARPAEQRKEKRDTGQLTAFGIKAEVLGRFDMIINLEELSADDYRRIIRESKDTAISAKREILAAEGVRFRISAAAAEHIVQGCRQSELGARYINQVVQRATRHMIYDIQRDPSINRVNLNWSDSGFVMQYAHGPRRVPDGIGPKEKDEQDLDGEKKEAECI